MVLCIRTIDNPNQVLARPTCSMSNKVSGLKYTYHAEDLHWTFSFADQAVEYANQPVDYNIQTKLDGLSCHII